VFCGLGRIILETESSDSEQPEHRNKHKKPSASSGQKTSPAKAEKNRPKSSSRGRDFNVESFKRDIPDGGWFRATTAGLRTDLSQRSGDTSESLSASSAADEEKPSKFQQNLRCARGVKIKRPFTFDGRADLDLFDQWTYEIDTWREWSGISDRMTVKIMVNFMSGKASRFFMKHVALRQKDWTLKSVYEALFNYCFPPDFKL
jgi:hypothetical protein